MDIAGVVAAFETELSVTDLLVPEFSPKPIATAASPAVTHMTARLIEVELLHTSNHRYFDGNNKGPLLSARLPQVSKALVTSAAMAGLTLGVW